jgi:hypothetical protein
MKRLFLLMLKIWREQIYLYVYATLIGAVAGLLILTPSYDYINAREHKADGLRSIAYAIKQLTDMLTGRLSHDELMLMMFYAEIGALLGFLSLLLYTFWHKRLQRIEQLKLELDKDLPSIIRQGEGAYLEFKSSLRWDLAESRINRNLELVILKTLAGFLNSHIGGTLLIGVNDNGEMLGLEKDYQTLKKPNQDGFEQALMTAVSTHLGPDVCSFIHVLFHVLDGKEVCRVIISPANRPVFLEYNQAPKFYVRTGGATRELNIQEALGFVPRRWKGNQ